MKRLSKEAGSDWSKLSEIKKRKYYHLAKKDEVKNEVDSGKNKYTNKTFEMGEMFSFIVETPKESHPFVKTNHQKNPQPGSALNDDNWFEEYIDYEDSDSKNEIINGFPPPNNTPNSYGR
ncbi:hypothetical protein RclHR1_20580001 [Rhizophagus clarus]|nr:hypothetical protein RclHR1_20580001 [Rhizophagus clarus]